MPDEIGLPEPAAEPREVAGIKGEGGEARETDRRVEKATFEPEAVIEREGGFLQAEAVETAFREAMDAVSSGEGGPAGAPPDLPRDEAALDAEPASAERELSPRVEPGRDGSAEKSAGAPAGTGGQIPEAELQDAIIQESRVAPTVGNTLRVRDDAADSSIRNIRGASGSADAEGQSSGRDAPPAAAAVTLEQAFGQRGVPAAEPPVLHQREAGAVLPSAGHRAAGPETGAESHEPVQESEEPESESTPESLETAAQEAVAEAQRAATVAEAAEHAAEAAHANTESARAEEMRTAEEMHTARAELLEIVEQYDMGEFFDPACLPPNAGGGADPLEDAGRWPSQEAFEAYRTAKAELLTATYAWQGAESAYHSAVLVEASLVQQAASAAAEAESAAAAAKAALTAWAGEEAAEQMLAEALEE